MDASDARSVPRPADHSGNDAFRLIVERAVRECLAGIIGEPLTEPLGVGEWAGLFDVHRQTMSRILRLTDGAEQFGRLWRLPLSKAPPKYWMDRGLLPAADRHSVDFGR